MLSVQWVLSDLKSIVHEKQYLFMQKLKSRADFSDSNLDNIFQLGIKVMCPKGVQLQTFFNTPVWSANFSAKEKSIRLQEKRNSDNTSSMTYSIMNHIYVSVPNLL